MFELELTFFPFPRADRLNFVIILLIHSLDINLII